MTHIPTLLFHIEKSLPFPDTLFQPFISVCQEKECGSLCSASDAQNGACLLLGI